MESACPAGHPSAHGSWMAAKRVSSLGEDDSVRDGAWARSPHPRMPRSSCWSGTCPLRGRPKGAAGEEQEAAAGRRMHQQQDQQPPPCPAAWQGTSAAPASPQCPQQPPGTAFLPSCVVLLENWSLGTALSLWDTWEGEGPCTARRNNCRPGPASRWGLPLLRALSGAATVPKSPQLPLLLPPPGGI